MSNPVYTRRPAETLGSDALAELALDLRWSFNHAADTIWQRLDPVLWNLIGGLLDKIDASFVHERGRAERARAAEHVRLHG